MTREEAITNLNMICIAFVDPVTREQRKLINDTFKIAIEALEKEPCEDAISRDAVLKKAVYTETEDGWCGYTVDVDYIKSLPPVTPCKKGPGN